MVGLAGHDDGALDRAFLSQNGVRTFAAKFVPAPPGYPYPQGVIITDNDTNIGDDGLFAQIPLMALLSGVASPGRNSAINRLQQNVPQLLGVY